jgi:hypothetical protein
MMVRLISRTWRALRRFVVTRASWLDLGCSA